MSKRRFVFRATQVAMRVGFLGSTGLALAWILCISMSQYERAAVIADWLPPFVLLNTGAAIVFARMVEPSYIKEAYVDSTKQ